MDLLMQRIIVLIIALYFTIGFCFSKDLSNTKVIIPFGPGGGTDTIFRKIQKFGVKQNLKLVGVYKPGANGLLGLKELYNSPADGLHIGIITFDVLSAFQDPLDLNNILPLQKNTFGIIGSSDRDQTLQQLVNSASDKNPLKIGYLLPIQKAIVVKTMELYNIKVDQVIYVPYKTGGQMIQNVFSKDIDIAITSLNVLAPLVKSNALRLLAVDSSEPIKTFPNAFLLKKLDPSLTMFNKGSAIVLPPNSPDELRKFWSDFIEKYHNDVDVKIDSIENYWEPVTMTSTEIEKTINDNRKILQVN